MGALRDTAWPSLFGQPEKAGLAIAQQNVILSNNFEVNTRRLNPMSQPLVLDIRWIMSSFGAVDVFATFEGWYRHNIWRGIRGCVMDLEIGGTVRTFTVFFIQGYTATCIDLTTALYSVEARVDAVEVI